MYLVSLLPAALLAAVLFEILTGTQAHHQVSFPVLVSIAVCAVHVVVLVMYPIRRTKPLGLLLGVMGCVSILCLFLLAVAGQPDYQVHSTAPVLVAPPK